MDEQAWMLRETDMEAKRNRLGGYGETDMEAKRNRLGGYG